MTGVEFSVHVDKVPRIVSTMQVRDSKLACRCVGHLRDERAVLQTRSWQFGDVKQSRVGWGVRLTGVEMANDGVAIGSTS